jgi:murein DD-endopeptidase MepM/ murein hydrolase activator NlpD
MIGAAGHEDATYPHLHFEFRKDEPKEDNSVHPLHYLHYLLEFSFEPPCPARLDDLQL